jgi:type IV pilus assembly protein PilX
MKKHLNLLSTQSLKTQHGLVLFVALIALVAMSLAAAALIRSVDSSVLVAGNLAFKKSATMAADSSLTVASNFIRVADLNTTDATNGYYARLINDPAAVGYVDLSRDSAVWTDTGANAKSLQLTSATLNMGISADGTDVSGNRIRYVLQRMCRQDGVPSSTDCLFGSSKSEGGSLTDSCKKSGAGECDTQAKSTSPQYRLTAHVVGPKNTISLIQAYIY